MDSMKPIEISLDDFKKITTEKNRAIIMLYSLTEAYNAIKTTIDYNREDLTLRIVVSSLRFKELDVKISNKTMFGSSQGDAMSIRGRNDKRDFKNQNPNQDLRNP